MAPRLIRGWTGLAPLLASLLSCGHPPAPSYDEIVAASRHGKFTQAIEAAERRVQEFGRSGDTAQECRFRLLEAETLQKRDGAGDDVRARVLLAIPMPGGLDAGPPGVTSRRLKAADAIKFQDQTGPETARKLLEEAYGLASSLSLPGELAAIQILQSQLYFMGHNPKLAEAKARAAREVARTGGDRYQEAAALTALGVMRIRDYRFDAAIPLLTEAQSTALQDGAIALVQTDLINLGICYSFLGDFDQASAQFKQAQQMMSEPEARGKWADLWGSWGNVYMNSKRSALAIPLFEKAIAMSKKDSERAEWTRNLAEALVEEHRWEAASKAQAEVVRLDPESANSAKLIAARIADGQGRLEEAAALFRECLGKGIEHEELWEAHAGLAEIYMKTGAPESANQQFEEALTEINLTINQFVPGADIHQITYLSRLMNFYQDYVRALVAQNKKEKALSVVESSRARILTDRLTPERKRNAGGHARDYQRLARDAQASILSYWLAPGESFLWVVTAAKTHFFRLPPASQIDALVRSYRSEIENSPHDPLSVESACGRRLYETLIAPAQGVIPQGSPVVIVPDGALHLLNFETLPVYEEGRHHYWLEDARVATTPSLDLMAASGSRAKSGIRPVLVLGDPVPADPRFPRLEQADLEIRNLLSHMGSPENRVLTAAAATPGAYRSAPPRKFDVVHFSAHAVPNEQDPLESFIALSGGQENFKLYARDVIGIPLEAELVTISACHAAGRSYSGEGLVGFVWAFMQAGARNVIASLWDVMDNSTPEMMDVLYREMAAGRTPADALHAAKLALVRREDSLRKPRYWGAFQVYVR